MAPSSQTQTDPEPTTKELKKSERARIEHALVQLADDPDRPDQYSQSGLYNLAEYIARDEPDTDRFQGKTWEFDELTAALQSMNESLTGDDGPTGTATLSGSYGFHVFADIEDGPGTAFPKALHVAIYEALGDLGIHVDHHAVAEESDEVTADTVMDHFMGQIYREGEANVADTVIGRLHDELEKYELIHELAADLDAEDADIDVEDDE